MTKDGRFSISRYRLNHAGRGDEESISKKQASIERISIRHELAAPPWFVQTEDDELVESLHWGTRFDGLERAWNKEKQVTDVKKQNVMVRLAVFTALKGCSLYFKRLTDDAAKFLINWGNSTNEELQC